MSTKRTHRTYYYVCTAIQWQRVGLVFFGNQTVFRKICVYENHECWHLFLYAPVIKTRHASFMQTNAYNLIVNILQTTCQFLYTPNYYCTFFVLALVFSTFFFASCLVLSLCDIFVFFFKTEYNHITFWSRYDNEILHDQNGATTFVDYWHNVRIGVIKVTCDWLPAVFGTYIYSLCARGGSWLSNDICYNII